jgi:hypothetical protein
MRQTGKTRAAILADATALVADGGLLAGLNFRSAEASLAAGDLLEASRRFRLAGETAEFPAADYAMGLAALTHYVHGRNDSYALELLLKARDQFPTSPLRDDFNAAIARMRDPASTILRRTSEAGTPGGFAAWVTVRSQRSVEFAATPRLVDVDGTGRRLLLRVRPLSSLFLARPGQRGQAVYSDLPTEVGRLAFSPTGLHLAFLAKGRTPVGHTWAAVYIIDVNANLVHGNAGALFTGSIDSDVATSEFAWEGDGKARTVQTLRAAGAPGEPRRVEIAAPRDGPVRGVPAPRGIPARHE